MTITLASKPGMTSSSIATSIPKDWDPKWFKSVIGNLMQGGDVRNAVGQNGILVSGNIASPYATIGFKAPVTLPAPVTINSATGQTSLIVNGAAGQFAEIVNCSSTGNGLKIAGATNQMWLHLENDNATGRTYAINPQRSGLANAGWEVYDITAGKPIIQAGIPDTTFLLTAYGPQFAGQLDITPDAETLNVNVTTGYASSTPISIVARKMGPFAIFSFGNVLAAGTGTTYQITGLPARWTPAFNQTLAFPSGAFLDNGARLTTAICTVTTAGAINFSNGTGAALVATGNRGISSTNPDVVFSLI